MADVLYGETQLPHRLVVLVLHAPDLDDGVQVLKWSLAVDLLSASDLGDSEHGGLSGRGQAEEDPASMHGVQDRVVTQPVP